MRTAAQPCACRNSLSKNTYLEQNQTSMHLSYVCYYVYSCDCSKSCWTGNGEAQKRLLHEQLLLFLCWLIHSSLSLSFKNVSISFAYLKILFNFSHFTYQLQFTLPLFCLLLPTFPAPHPLLREGEASHGKSITPAQQVEAGPRHLPACIATEQGIPP